MCFHVECESPELMWVRSDKDLDKRWGVIGGWILIDNGVGYGSGLDLG
jgi:hypothetical protein